MGITQEMQADLRNFAVEVPWKRTSRGLLTSFLLLVLNTVTAFAEETPIRPITGAEKAAVAWALEYLDGGAASWVNDLAPDSPWYQSPNAATEIELRAGPPAGARWRLATATDPNTAVFHVEMASLHQEVLRIQVAEVGGVAKILDLKAGWETTAGAPRSSAKDLGSGQPDQDAGNETKTASPPWALPPLIFGVAGLVMILLAFLMPKGKAIFGTLALVSLGLAAWFFLGRNSSKAAPEAAATTATAPKDGAVSEERLAWRRRLGLGESHLENLPAGDGLVQLWAAEEALLSHRLDLAAQALKAAESFAGSATALRLKARLAAARGDGTGAVLALEQLVQTWPYDEGFRLEAVGAAERFGFERQATELFTPLKTWGSRWAETQHRLALQNAIDGLMLSAADALEKGIHLEPTRRVDLLANPLAAVLIEIAPKLRARLSLDASVAPAPECPWKGSGGITLAAGQKAVRTGYSLHFRAKDGELEAPGACVLAPPGVVVSPGEAWLESQHQEILAAIAGMNSGRLLPANRRPLAEAIAAMAQEKDYRGILQMTDHLEPASLDSLPNIARRARVQALHRVERRQEALKLLVELVGADFDQSRSDPGMLFDFAELMVVEGQYELALRLLAAVDRRLPKPITADRRIQLTIEKKLVTQSLHFDRGNFRIFFSPQRDPHYARIVADYLEKEQRRLAKWIPVSKKPKTIEVLLLDPRDFRESYAGSGVDLIGLYDGRIRVPLGQIGRVGELAASILTHELAHALIADASDDQAPHWLHEGLAQMVEPGQKGLNPISAMKGQGTWLAFPLVEGALSGMATPVLARQGYEEALWSVIYLQTSRGPQIFGKLLEGYRQGKSEEQIFRQHFGTGTAGFDENLVSWARSGKVPSWETEAASLE